MYLGSLWKRDNEMRKILSLSQTDLKAKSILKKYYAS